MPDVGSAKRRVADLAILGGPSRFAAPLHVGRPNIGDRGALLARLERTLDDAWLTNQGPLVAEFEARVAEVTGGRHTLAVVNATSGIELAARALDLRGEVIVPSFTFVGTAHALDWLGLTPVFVDVRADRPTIDPTAVERLIGPATSAILGVHLWGHVCDVDALDALGAAHGLPVLYDAAHALMNADGGRPVGTFGTAEVFSFHATKFVNAFEGGAITTSDEGLATRIRRMRNFGFSGIDRTVSGGTNAKMHEATAAMGLTSLESAGRFIETNRRNAHAYLAALAGVPGLTPAMPDPDAGNAQYVVFLVDEARAALGRDPLVRILRAENVLARRYFHPGCHRLAPYAARADLVREPLTNTERFAAQALVLPTGTAVDVGDIEAIAELIGFALDHADEIGPRLARTAR